MSGRIYSNRSPPGALELIVTAHAPSAKSSYAVRMYLARANASHSVSWPLLVSDVSTTTMCRTRC